MDREEYLKHADEVDDWAPGWDAIEDCFKELYPGQEPKHYGTLMPSRARFGGDQYIDGYSIYQSKKGYSHIVTFGMSELYVNPDSFGGEYSRWGYEMTMKLPADTDYMWTLDVLSILARYTFTQSKFFEPFQYIYGSKNPIKMGSKTKLTSFIVVQDTELKEVDTLHGKLDFMQLVGITQKEVDAIVKNPDLAKALVEKMKNDNPMLVTDLSRKKEYL